MLEPDDIHFGSFLIFILLLFLHYFVVEYQDLKYTSLYGTDIASNVQQDPRTDYPGDKTTPLRKIFNSYNPNKSERYPPVNGNKNENSHITERQSGERFKSRRRSCRAQAGRQCRRNQLSNTSRIFETENKYDLYPEENRPIAESFYYPKGNLKC